MLSLLAEQMCQYDSVALIREPSALAFGVLVVYV